MLMESALRRSISGKSSGIVARLCSTSADDLQQALDSLLPRDVELQPQVQRKRVARGRRFQRPPISGSLTLQKPSSMIDWNPGPVPVLDPTLDLLRKQQDAHKESLEQDRSLMWYDQQQEMKRRVAAALQPKEDANAALPVELSPSVVQEIFNSVTADCAQELEERVELRRGESMAVHLEQLLALRAPEELRRSLGGRPLQLVGVEVPGPEEACGLHQVHFEVPKGLEGKKLQRLLNRLAPQMAVDLARQLLISAVPRLRFLQSSGSNPPMRRAALWHKARRERRAVVHGAMSSWVADMHF